MLNMTKLLLRIYDYLTGHRITAVVLLAVMLVAGALSALQLHYEENIARFLPIDKGNEKQAAVYNALGDQGQITVVFRPAEQAGDEEVMDAIDAFAEQFARIRPDIALQARADESDAMAAIEEVRNNIALYLTAADYERIDSLLANPDFVATRMDEVKQTLGMPLPEMVTEMIVADPLGLFTPAIGRLQALSPSSRYVVTDGYVMDGEGRGYAFMASPYNASDTRRNGRLAKDIAEAIDAVSGQMPTVSVSAVGAPLIAVTNANQIKRDSLVAMLLSLVLIAIILWRTMGHRRNILWMGFSVACGWLFALAVIAIFKTEISIIVVGIGSVLVGIAVNYPLHYLEHLKDHPDRRETLREMVEPLVTGNVTTVAAFACLVFVRAEAMRDLGLFGSLMLVGTIGFTMIFLPLWAKGGKRSHGSRFRIQDSEFKIQDSGVRGRTPVWVFWVMVAVTVVLGYFSTKVEFDSDLHNINFMTAQQEEDLKLLGSAVEEGELAYVVSEGHTLDEALRTNDSLHLPGVGALMPSLSRQREALERWNEMLTRHPDLGGQVAREAVRAGLVEGAFSPFVQTLTADYKAAECTLESAAGQLAKNYIMQTDTGYYVVNYIHQLPTADSQLPTTHSFVFTQKDVGSGLVNALNGDFNYILYVCSFVVFAFLWLALGRFELALLAFLPMAMGWLWILGLMALLGIKFNIVNIILATFIFGQGDDYTIFITEGLLYENATGKRRLKEYRRSVIVSALLMFAGIGTLLTARHPALRSLAEVAVIGMGCVVLMACVVPPVVFRWLTQRHGQPRRYPVTVGRIFITVVPLVVFILFALLVATPVTLVYFLLPMEKRRKRDSFHRFICSAMRCGARLMPRVGFKVENPYDENFDRPAVIVANHQSHLDLVSILMLTPKVVVLTKNWVWRNPLYAHIIRYAEYLPAEAGYDNLIPRLRDLVARGYSVMVFPEGTRSVDGQVHRFHKGAFLLAEELGLPLLPVFIHGAYDVWPKTESLITGGRITIRIGERCHDDSRGMRRHFEEELSAMRERLETPEYKCRLTKYQYLYKGREVWNGRPGKEAVS